MWRPRSETETPGAGGGLRCAWWSAIPSFPWRGDDLKIDGVTLTGVGANGRSMNLEAQWTMGLVEDVNLDDEETEEEMCEAISDCLCVVVEMPHGEVEGRGIARGLLLEAPGDDENLEVAFEDWMGLAVTVAKEA